MSISSNAEAAREAARGPGGKFGEQPRSEGDVDLAGASHSELTPVGGDRRISGFRYVRFREDRARTDETPAFTADIELDGTKVGSVVNDGHGGADRIMFDDQSAERRFEAAASRHFGDETSWGSQESLSLELAWRAEVAAAFSRKRKLVATRDGDPSPWTSGQHLEFKGSREEFSRAVEGDEHTYRVWDKQREDFIALQEATTRG